MVVRVHEAGQYDVARRVDHAQTFAARGGLCPCLDGEAGTDARYAIALDEYIRSARRTPAAAKNGEAIFEKYHL
jgi:hypothetical protein